MHRATAISSVFGTLIAIVVAYDFSDIYFNQYLSGELRDLYSFPNTKLLHLRNRRDEEAVKDEERCHRRFEPPMCCGKELHRDLMNFEVKRQCFQEVLGLKENDKTMGPPPDPFKCDRSNHHRNEMICIFQCVGQKKNLVEESGQLKEMETKDYIKNIFSKYEWIKSKEDEIIDKCMDETKTKLEEWKKNSSEEQKCTPTIMFFSHCIYKEVQLACPEEEISDKKICDRIKENIAKNGSFLQPPPEKPMNYK